MTVLRDPYKILLFNITRSCGVGFQVFENRNESIVSDTTVIEKFEIQTCTQFVHTKRKICSRISMGFSCHSNYKFLHFLELLGETIQKNVKHY